MAEKDNCESFNQLKTDLKEKYTKNFINMLEETKKEFDAVIDKVLGEQFIALKKEVNDIKQNIKFSRESYFQSKEYVEVKTTIQSLKQQIDEETDEKIKDNLTDELRDAINEISTLNVKLNNRLKESRELLKEKVCTINSLIDLNKNALNFDFEKIASETKTGVDEIVKNYNIELQELCQAFNQPYKDKELPFDPSMIKVEKIPIYDFREDSFENDEKNEITEGKISEFNKKCSKTKTMIFSDNNSTFKN